MAAPAPATPGATNPVGKAQKKSWHDRAVDTVFIVQVLWGGFIRFCLGLKHRFVRLPWGVGIALLASVLLTRALFESAGIQFPWRSGIPAEATAHRQAADQYQPAETSAKEPGGQVLAEPVKTADLRAGNGNGQTSQNQASKEGSKADQALDRWRAAILSVVLGLAMLCFGRLYDLSRTRHPLDYRAPRLGGGMDGGIALEASLALAAGLMLCFLAVELFRPPPAEKPTDTKAIKTEGNRS